MQSVIPFLIIIAALATIVVIIVRKYPQLILLDIESLPEIKQGKKKNDVFKSRIEKRARTRYKKRASQFKPFVQWFKERQLSFRKYVGNVERKMVNETRRIHASQPIDKKLEIAQKVKNIVKDAEHSLQNGQYQDAEHKYIEALRIDPKNKVAYQGLAEVYFKQKQYQEAEETYKYLLHLNKRNDEVLVRLAVCSEEQGNIKDAISYYKRAILINNKIAKRFVDLSGLLQKLERLEESHEAIKKAVSLESQNPKYLDIMIELSILLGDKETAKQAYDQLRLVNAKNTKLGSFKDRIAALD